MLLETSSESALRDANTGYLIFYSSIDATNKMDCRRIEDVVRDAFEPVNAPSALIVYVGQREEWKGKPENPYRREPWKVNSVPTIVRVRDDARLVDEGINEASLSTFIRI